MVVTCQQLSTTDPPRIGIGRMVAKDRAGSVASLDSGTGMGATRWHSVFSMSDCQEAFSDLCPEISS